MAKKIAAPRKAARKTPARKTVSAPKAYKPKGSAKEKLSYLNKQEMAALVKRKGTPPRRGPSGLPSFADDSASSKGVSRGDSSGTKGSGSTKTSSGSVSNSSGGGGYNSGSSGSRGGGASSQSPGAGGSSGRGQGGQGGYNSGAGRDSSRGIGQGAGAAAIGKGYNSGTKGSRSGGASTQKPGMGRNSGQVGPRSPMGGQGTSFATNKAARDDTLRRAYGIEDQRGRQNMPQRPYFDRKREVTINPNNPYEREQADKDRQIRADKRDRDDRAQARAETDRYRNPQEIRESARDIRKSINKMNQLSESASYEKTNPMGQDQFRVNVGRSAASGRLPDVKLGGPREGTLGGYSGGGMGGTFRGGGFGEGGYTRGRGGQGWKAGGLVKKNSNKSFKKK